MSGGQNGNVVRRQSPAAASELSASWMDTVPRPDEVKAGALTVL